MVKIMKYKLEFLMWCFNFIMWFTLIYIEYSLFAKFIETFALLYISIQLFKIVDKNYLIFKGIKNNEK
jgi:hypothetical protein